MDVRASGVLTADDDIVILPPSRSGLDQHHVLHLGCHGGVAVWAERAQLIRLRNALTAHLSGDAA